ncbi:hypothetical protein C8R44DRAFT_754213 [Mycena epipterygia]|nr:hypothetical protein C8R44DRAFT_754213 [Mycena epipterygia]
MADQLAVFKSARREIRGREIIADDLKCFQKGSKVKVPGTTIDVVGALIQLLAHRDGHSDFAVFSSWLSPLISRKVPQGTHHGTIDGHILDACLGEPKERLMTKARWVFPLYGDNPPHWVLGYLELGAREFHIFNGCPELNFYMWAEPALTELGESVYAYLGFLDVNLAPWKVYHDSPSMLMRQMNGWACGFFTIHDMQVVAKGESTAAVTNEHTERIQKETLEMILTNLFLLEKPIAPLAAEDTDADCNMNPAGSDEIDTQIDNPIDNGIGMSDSPIDNNVGMNVDTDVDSQITHHTSPALSTDVRDNSDAPVASSSKRKLPSIDTDTNLKPLKKLKRLPKLSNNQRKEVLESNQWISLVEPHRVKCQGCATWVKLAADRTYKPDNWERHESKCPNITGVRKIRIAVKPTAKPPASKSSSDVAITSVNKPTTAPASWQHSKEMNESPEDDSNTDTKGKSKTRYTTRVVSASPSIAGVFAPGPIKNPPRKPIVIPQPLPCQYLSGDDYREYIERTETRSMGGISPTLRGRIARQILFYKKLNALKKDARTPESDAVVESSIPTDGNACIASRQWTNAEHVKLDDALQGYARWEVNFAKKIIRSTHCEGLTTNTTRKKQEASLSMEEQHEVLVNRNNYSHKLFADTEARKIQELLNDPLVFKAFKNLENDEPTSCFIELYEAARDGKLKKHETLTDLCKVVAEMLKRDGSNKKYGMRYPAHYLNFMILMRSYGGNLSQQYGILNGELPCPSSRHLRTLVAGSEDALQNPELIYENIARAKRLADSIEYTGPVAVAGDCTKVRKRLTYSNDFGGHILGGVLPFLECIAEDREDIEQVMQKIQKAKAEASQVRAILIKVAIYFIPLPHIPPQVVALLPTDGKDNAAKIVEQNLKLLQMAAELSLPIISFAADGAASELAAQNLMDKKNTPFPAVAYDYPLYGVHLRAPVMKTGPVVSNTDAFHARKTGRNQPQYGTKTESMGEEVLVNDNLVQLYETGESGMLHSDVNNTDRQDDGPARHIFHYQALLACTTGDGDGMQIRGGFGGLFVYLFILGNLFDAWLNRMMTVQNRVVAVLRARFFLHFWRAHIPFCPWLLLTDFVEHFFGLARMMLPNFTYAEFLKIVQHIMVRQRILLSGSFKEKRERKAGLGKDDSDSDPDEDEDEDDDQEVVDDELEVVSVFSGVKSAAHDAARYSALCDDYEAAVKEAGSLPERPPPPPPPPSPDPSPSPLVVKSEFIVDGKLSIAMMLQARLHWQSGTTTKSEKVVRIDSRFALSRIAKGEEPEKMTLQEASNAVRVLQDLNSATHANKPRKYLLPNITAKNVHALNPLSVGSYAVMWNGTRFYIGEILDDSSEPDQSDDEDDRDPALIDAPIFSCRHKTVLLYTHAKIDHLLFNLGSEAFEKGRRGGALTLTQPAALKWTTLTKPGPVAKELKQLTTVTAVSENLETATFFCTHQVLMEC